MEGEYYEGIINIFFDAGKRVRVATLLSGILHLEHVEIFSPKPGNYSISAWLGENFSSAANGQDPVPAGTRVHVFINGEEKTLTMRRKGK